MYTIDPAMSFGEVILYYEKYLTETKAEGKNQYPSCISLQADTNSRLNRTIAQSYPVLCHPAIFISVQADALHEKLHQKKYHLPESLTSPPNVPLPLKKFLHSQSGRPT